MVKDNAAVKNELGKELGLDSDSCKKLSAADMVRTLTANFKGQLYVTFGSDIQTSSTDLYAGYVHWCAENALTALRQDTFVGWLKSNERKYNIKYVYHVPGRNGGHVRGFRGIKTKFVPIVT